MQHGAISLCRLAAYVASVAQTASAASFIGFSSLCGFLTNGLEMSEDC
jgi:hypothetical protein